MVSAGPRRTQRFKSPGHAQPFLAAHSIIYGSLPAMLLVKMASASVLSRRLIRFQEPGLSPVMGFSGTGPLDILPPHFRRPGCLPRWQAARVSRPGLGPYASALLSRKVHRQRQPSPLPWRGRKHLQNVPELDGVPVHLAIHVFAVKVMRLDDRALRYMISRPSQPSWVECRIACVRPSLQSPLMCVGNRP